MSGSLLVDNARIWTGVPERPRAGRVLIEAGRVSAIDGPAGGAEGRLDAAGAVVLPGLIDAHVHLLWGGLALGELDLADVGDPDAFKAAIARRHEALPPGQWLLAGGWSEADWPGRPVPDRSWLAAAGDRPVVCRRRDLHGVLVNDAVLAMIEASTDMSADPPGGRIVRDGRGAPTGLLLEAAAWELVNPIVPEPGVEARRDAVRAAQRHAHARGLTAVGSMEYRRDVETVFAPLRDELTLRCRITLMDRRWPLDPAFGAAFPGDDRLAVIGYKAFLDGTFGSRTARMSRPWADDPGNRGMLVELAAEGHLEAWAATIAAAGLSPSMHAIGDEAVRLALDVAAGLGAAAPRCRIEHAQFVAPEDVPRFAGLVASMQPLHRADDGRTLAAALGPERLDRAYPFRALADAGARLAFGSDWPVESCDPLAGVRAAVTGLDADGRAVPGAGTLSVEEALLAYTTGAADALGLDAGRLRHGAPGDLVLLDADPFTASWERSPPRVRLTVAGGRVVYDDR